MKPSRRKRKLARFKAKMRKSAIMRLFMVRMRKPKYQEKLSMAFFEEIEKAKFAALGIPAEMLVGNHNNENEAKAARESWNDRLAPGAKVIRKRPL